MDSVKLLLQQYHLLTDVTGATGSCFFTSAVAQSNILCLSVGVNIVVVDYYGFML